MVPPPFAVAVGESLHRGNEQTRLRIKAAFPQADELAGALASLYARVKATHGSADFRRHS
jgi:hypothetical protein